MSYSRTYLNNIEDYKHEKRTKLSRLNNEQKKEVLRREGYDNNEAIFGSKNQFKYFPLGFLSRDRKIVKEAEVIFERIHSKANLEYVFNPDKLSTTRVLNHIIKDVENGKLTRNNIKKTHIQDLSDSIKFWINKSERRKKKQVQNKEATEKKVLSEKALNNRIKNFDKTISNAHSKKQILHLLDKYEKDNKNLDVKSRTTIAENLSRNPTIVKLIKENANYQCEICGELGFEKENGERYVEVHHINELAKSKSNLPSNLICVCATCHRKFHYGSDKVKKSLTLKKRQRK